MPSPTNVKTSDTQKVTSIEYGIIKSSAPVKIKGEANWIGATAGGMIGGLLGTAVCGEEEIIGTKCQDIAVVFGTIGGGNLEYLVIDEARKLIDNNIANKVMNIPLGPGIGQCCGGYVQVKLSLHNNRYKKCR